MYKTLTQQTPPPPARWDAASVEVKTPELPDMGPLRVRRFSTLVLTVLAACFGLGLLFLLAKFRASMMQPQYMLMGLLSMAGIGSTMWGRMRGGKSKTVTDMDTERQVFDTELVATRELVNSCRKQHYVYDTWVGPDPKDLVRAAGSGEQWRCGLASLTPTSGTVDARFGLLRVGVGETRAASRFDVVKVTETQNIDFYAFTRLQCFKEAFTKESKWPINFDFLKHQHVFLYGELAVVQQFINALVAQIGFRYNPEDTKIVVIVDPSSGYSFDHFLWLPHYSHPVLRDESNGFRLRYGNYFDFLLNSKLVEDREKHSNVVNPHVKPFIVILDFTHYDNWQTLTQEGWENTTIIHVNNTTLPPDGGGVPVFYVEETQLLYQNHRQMPVEMVAKPDLLTNLEAETLYRAIGKYVLPNSEEETVENQKQPDFLTAHGIYNIDRIDFRKLRETGANLETTFTSIFGYDPVTKVPLRLRMREPDDTGPGVQAQGQSGMMLGRQGSGKSGVIHPLLVSTLLTHGPDDLIVHLSDFKGFLTFHMYRDHPQVVGMNSNLDFNQFGIIRFIEGVSRENENRQHLFNDTSTYLTEKTGRSVTVPNWQTYDKLRLEHPELKPNPWYWIVLDEVGETLKHHPYLAEWLSGGLRTWRAQKIAIFATTQTTSDAHKFKLLIPNIGYRMITATVVGEDSQAMLDSNLALARNDEEARSQPGHGWLNVGTIHEFQAYPLVKKYLPPKQKTIQHTSLETSQLILDWGHRNGSRIETQLVEESPYTQKDWDAANELYVEILDRMRKLNEPKQAPKVPPALTYCTTHQAIGELETTNNLHIPIGMLDRPQNLDQPVLYLNLTSKGLKIGGAPGQGATSLLATIITNGALTHTPQGLSFLIYSFNNPELLRYVQQVPHVIDGAAGSDMRRLNALTNQLTKIIDQRNNWYQNGGSLQEMRTATQQKQPSATPDKLGDVLVLIDGYSNWIDYMGRRDLNFNPEVYITTAQQVGVNFIITGIDATDSNRPGLGAIPDIIEFSLTDPTLTMLPKEAVSTFAPATKRLQGNPFLSTSSIAQTVPKHPGAIITRHVEKRQHQWLIGQIFVPTVDKALPRGQDVPNYLFTEEATKLAPYVQHYERTIEPIKLLPPKLTQQDFLNYTGGQEGTALIENHTIPYRFTGEGAQNYIVFGEHGCGKTSALIQVIKTITTNKPPTEARFYCIDPTGRVGKYMTEQKLEDYFNLYTHDWETWDNTAVYRISNNMRDYAPPENLTPTELTERAWLQNKPHVYLIIDAIETTPHPMYGDSKTTELLPFMRQAKNLNLHTIVSTGILGTTPVAVMQAVNTPIIQTLLQQGADYNVMSLPDGGEYSYGGVKRLGTQPKGRACLFSPVHNNSMQLIQYPMVE